MKNSPTPCISKWATFRAAWIASEGPRGRAIDPTLYSEECLAKWLPLKLSTGLPALLWFLMFYDLFFLIVGLEGTAADWLWWIDGVVLFFWLSSYQVVLFPWLCVDLHKRRRHRLSPKRIIITAGSGLFVLLVASSILGYSYFSFGLYVSYDWTGSLCADYGIFCTNLSALLPFLAIFGFAFYALYLVFGLVALFRDFDVKPSDEVDEVHAKHVNNEVPICPTAVELSDSDQISHGRSIHTQPSSAYDSSVAEMSGNTSMTMPPSTEASNSLVTAGSARSSALISCGSSELPAYSGRISMVESQRHSGEEQPQDGSFSRPAMVYFRAEHISLA